MKTYENYIGGSNFIDNDDREFKPGYVYVDEHKSIENEYYIFIGDDTDSDEFNNLFLVLKENNKNVPYFYFIDWDDWIKHILDEVGPMEEFIIENGIIEKTLLGFKKKISSEELSRNGKRLIRIMEMDLNSQPGLKEKLEKEKKMNKSKEFNL